MTEHLLGFQGPQHIFSLSALGIRECGRLFLSGIPFKQCLFCQSSLELGAQLAVDAVKIAVFLDPVLIARCEDGFVHITTKFAPKKFIVLGTGMGKERAESLAEAVLPVGNEPAFHFRSS